MVFGIGAVAHALWGIRGYAGNGSEWEELEDVLPPERLSPGTDGPAAQWRYRVRTIARTTQSGAMQQAM